MSKSYLAKTKISFVEDNFYVNTGDILVHDAANNNTLVVYRGGQIVKVMHHSPLKVLSMLRSKFIEEVNQPIPAPVRQPTREEIKQKRAKAVPREVPIEELPSHIRELAEKRKEEVKAEDASA